MRIWHKDLIPVLPTKQLVSQWRECCCIAKNISEKGTPNHILVNRIMDYPLYHFITYAKLVKDEMIKRGYKCNWEKFMDYISPAIRKTKEVWSFGYVDKESLFNNKPVDNWHDYYYLRECLFNLEEKVRNGGIPYNEWQKILNYVDSDECEYYFDLWR